MEQRLDKYYTPHPLSKVKGAIFKWRQTNKASPKPTDIYGTTICLETEREKIDRFYADPNEPFLIIVHPTYGQPGKLAYRILIGIERYLNKHQEREIKLTLNELLNLADVTRSQQRDNDIVIALDQLSQTKIVYHSKPYLDTRKNIRRSYSLISYEVKKCSGQAQFKIKVDEVITDALLKNKRYHLYNFDRIAHLDPMVQCFALCVLYQLTRRKIKHDKKGATDRWYYHKSYDRVCEHWLGGLSPRANASRAMTAHLQRRIEPLVNCGILDAESKLDSSMNLILYPGEGFFTDYALLHPKPTATVEELQQRQDLVELCDKQLLLNRPKHHKDPYHAKSLIDEFGFEEAKRYVVWAAQQANVTKFDIKYLSGLSVYKKDYLKHKPAPRPKAPPKPTEVDLQHYEHYLNKHYQRIEESLNDLERTAYQQHYEQLYTPSGNTSTDEVLKQFVRRQSLDNATRSSPMGIDQWFYKRQKKPEAESSDVVTI